MADWFASGRIIDIVLLLVALEALALAFWRRRSGRSPSGLAMLPNLLAGASLMLALRFALTGMSWVWIALMMVVSLIAHAFDLAARLRP
ncbi:MAG: hypothetical protein K2P80_03840 [Beijerinckiaceae bacterium]|nr:hypothetical protein [Beijerinckiaceae bacterium]